VPSLSAEVDAVEAACAALASPVVYCHNDLLAPNLLLGTPDAAPASASAQAPSAQQEAALHIIDFEYGGYNYRGFDLGNHFNEWAGFDCDYSRYENTHASHTYSSAMCRC
jgi:ethanolamine kinase